MFEVADIWLKVDDKNNVQVKRVTPPEAQYFIMRYAAVAKGNPIDHIAKRGHIKRSNIEMKNYLVQRFGSELNKDKKMDVPRIDVLYPGMSPDLPKTFEELYMSNGQGGNQPWSPNNSDSSPKKGQLIDEMVPANFQFANANKIIVADAKEVTEDKHTFMRVTWPDGNTEDIPKDVFDLDYQVAVAEQTKEQEVEV